MLAVIHTVAGLVLAAADSSPAKEESSNFLVSPDVGLMLWTLISFVIALVLLRKYAWPSITEALDKRQRAIEDSIDAAAKTKIEADALLSEYRERLKDARSQADDIVARARKTGEEHERESIEEAKAKREELMQATRRDIEAETRRALQEIRSEVADLTVQATEKVMRKSLTEADQKRLVEEALGEIDFSALAADRQN